MITSNHIWSKGILTFWSWNDRITPQGVVERLRKMKEQGLDGVFVHSRGGLAIEYMGEEWMTAIEAVVEEAKSLDMEVWLYDEDGWPSGFCGGKVNGRGVEFQMKWLSYEIGKRKDLHLGQHTVAAYVQSWESEVWKPVDCLDLLAESQTVLHIFYEVNPYYSDLLNPEAMDYFIETTHEVYKKRLGHEFGKTIKGIFTDEPQYAGGRLPWSPYLGQLFRELHGYPIENILPELVLGREISTKYNHDYWMAVSECIVSCFTKKLGEWCESNNLCLTGHIACEDTLRMQLEANGGAMRHYEWIHMPAIDHVGRRLTRPVFLKQLSSVAYQLDRRQILSEMYGASGWVTSLADLKRIADWQFTLGINVQCQHLSAYSLRGLRKRDCPPAISPQQPWWEDMGMFNSYVKNVFENITAGRPVSELLILHPLTSAWCVYNMKAPHRVLEIDRRLGEITDLLLDMQRDFDYGDEKLLERYGRVEGDCIIIGRMSYKMVILPSLYSIEKNTFEILKAFVTNGGKVVSFGRLPEWLDGEESVELKNWCMQHVPSALPKRKTAEAFLDSLPAGIRVTDVWGKPISAVQCLVRQNEDTKLYFLMNMNHQHPVTGKLQWLGAYEISGIDSVQGNPFTVDFQMINGLTGCDFSLAPSETAIYVVRQVKEKYGSSRQKRGTKEQPVMQRTSAELAGEWAMEGHTGNTLTLDYCNYRLKGEPEWRGVQPVIRVQNELTRLKKNACVELLFQFQIDELYDLENDLLLAVEMMDEHELFINDKAVPVKVLGKWFDPSIDTMNIKFWLSHGTNTLRLVRFFEGDFRHPYLDDPEVFETERNRFCPRSELENIYLIGNFSIVPRDGYSIPYRNSIQVENEVFTLGRLQDRVMPSDLTCEGMPFFAGTVRLKREFQYGGAATQVEIELYEPSACVTGIEINGKMAGKMAWEPYRLDITQYLVPGTNTIILHLTSGFRNLLGPHHHYRGDVTLAGGPNIFEGRVDWEERMDAYILPSESWVDRYNFVPFGTGNPPIIHFYRKLKEEL